MTNDRPVYTYHLPIKMYTALYDVIISFTGTISCFTFEILYLALKLANQVICKKKSEYGCLLPE